MNIQQNTPEWLQMRKNHIGASDAPIIMGDSPWKTPHELWEEKMGLCEQPQMNFAMARGHELEPIARQAYIDHTGIIVEPSVVFHPEYEWMMASLDGLSNDRSVVVEIKCPGKVDHDIAKSGEIPKKYYAQLQHQLAVINLNMLHYFSYRDDDYQLIEVHRDDAYIKKMYIKENKFWEDLQNFNPPELCDRDYVQRDDQTWIDLANEWSNLNFELSSLKEKEKILRDTIIAESAEKNCQGSGIKVKKMIRKGVIDYKNIAQLVDVDLEQYRKPSSEMWRIST